MKTRKNLVVTYIKIVLVIAIIAVGLYWGIKALNKGYNNEEYETIKTNMLLIQGKTEVIAQKVEIEEEGAEYIGTKIQDKQDDAKIQNLVNNNVINLKSEDNNYYCIDNSNLEELGLSEINIENLENWDSFAHLKIIIALEDEFDIDIEPDDEVEVE